MRCQVPPRVCWIQVPYRCQLYADVQRPTRRVDAVNEEIAELPVASETEQKSRPCRVVRGPRVTAATWQQSWRQTSVVSTNIETECVLGRATLHNSDNHKYSTILLTHEKQQN